MRQEKSVYIILFVCLIWSLSIFNQEKWKDNNIIVSDVLNYYSYLPALLIEQDLAFDYRDTKENRGNKDVVLGNRTEAGNFVPKMSLGAAILYSPFFLMAHGLSGLLSYNSDGFSMIYSILMCIGHVFYAFLGLFYLRKILRLYFSDSVTSLTIFTIAFCTNLFHYCTGEIGMPHAYSLFLFLLFVWLTIKWHKSPSYKTSISIGLIVGLILLIRPTNGIIALVFILYNVFNKESLNRKWDLFIVNWKKILVLILVSITAVFPQLIFWKLASGSFVFYSYGEEGFYFGNPQIVKGLFSYRKGWLLYTPIMSFALLGFYMLYKKLKEFFLPILIFTIVNIYIVFSWWCWWYGGGFGQRALIESYALLAVPLACFYNYFLDKKVLVKVLIGAIIVFTGVLNLVQTEQYKYCLHYDGMTKEAYWEIFFARHGFKWPEGIGYRSMIKRPDYDSAMKGLEEYSNGEASDQKKLDEQIDRIIKNKEWYDSVKNQAIEKGISIDSALVRNARYTLNS
jgi:hypothetical protein